MTKSLFAFVFVFSLFTFSSGDALAGSNGLITKPSPFSVNETINRLERLFVKKGITIAARIDHAKNAAKVKLKLRPTTTMVFGNPKLGTPLMTSNQEIGIDLPLKIVAWQDKKGKTWIAYNDPEYLAKRHGIKDRAKVFAKMTGVLKKLTTAALAKKKKPMVDKTKDMSKDKMYK